MEIIRVKNKIRLIMKHFGKIITGSALLIAALAFTGKELNAQETNKTKNQPVELKSNYSGSRGYTGAFAKIANTTALGLSKYLRWVVHDGNLVTGAAINSGLLGYHYVSGAPTMAWPKGANSVSYLHGAVFYVAAEVQDVKGDTIHIVSDNYRRGGETALDQSHFYGFMPLPKYYNNHETNSTQWDMDGISEDVGIDGLPNTHDEGEGDGILQTEEDFNGNGKLDVSMINTAGWFAISHRKDTWPKIWPVGSFPGDDRKEGDEKPSIRDGRWNGEFGAYIRADQESYYAMDDRENDEFNYYPFDDANSKLPWPNGRRGLGIKVEVRNYQWSSRLAEDILISVYDITNQGKDLNKCIVGMYVDPDLGGSLEGDDASFDNIDDITYAFNRTGLSTNGLPIGYFGFAFLESPGLASDGIDNDNDGMIDESQNNGIDDDHDWVKWTDLNGNGVWDNEDKNHNGKLDPGEDTNGNGKLDIEPLNDDVGSDGIGPNDEDYTGPDPDGTEANGKPDPGEPNFEFTDNDESDQVGLTSFYLRDVDNTMANDEKYWNTEIQPGNYIIRPGYQRDIAWSYGSGFVKFAGTEKRHRYAIALLFGNDEADILRNKKTMQVIYDNDYNFSKPPKKPALTVTPGNNTVTLEWDDNAERSKDPIYGNDFECYYIYKSTDPTFNDIKTITDAFGNPLLLKPIAIFDLKDGLTGINPVRIGSEIGPESDLGTSYNMGTDSGLKHFYQDKDVTNGRTYYYAVVSVDKGYLPSFYPKISEKEGLQVISPTECSANIQTDLLGRAIATDKNTAIAIPVEPPAGWVYPTIDSTGIVQISGKGTGKVEVEIVDPNQVHPDNVYHVKFADDGSFKQYSEAYNGIMSSATLYDATGKISLISVEDPEHSDRGKEFIAHGLKISITNDTSKFDKAYWKTGMSNLLVRSTTVEDNGVVIPRDYEIRVLDMGAGKSVNSVPIITNFQIWDVTKKDSAFQVGFRYSNNISEPDAMKGVLSEGDKLQIVSDYSTTKRLNIYEFYYASGTAAADKKIPQPGDVISITSRKTFDRDDIFEFITRGNNISNKKASNDLANIYTVPDPYIAVSSLERKVINADEGRGDRRIDFVNLPKICTITIFTTSGRLVRKLEHNVTENNSRESWDLRTKDGLEITHGIYFWVVEASGVGKKTGRLAVIK